MTILWITIGTGAFAGVLVRLIELVRTDGYGVRPPPRSHLDWDASNDLRFG
jgi:hypothetical protein